MDPRQYGDDFLGLLKLNARASERSVDAFLAWCSRRPRACTFGDGNAEAAVDDLIRRLDDEPLVTGRGKRRAVTNGYTVAEILYLQTGSGRGAWKDTGQALVWGHRALELATRLGDDRTRAHALVNLGTARTQVDFAEGASLLEAHAVAHAAGEREEAGRALGNLGYVLMTWVEPEPAWRYAVEALSYAREHEV